MIEATLKQILPADGYLRRIASIAKRTGINYLRQLEPDVLSKEQIENYCSDGYLELPAFISRSQAKHLGKTLDRVWKDRGRAPASVTIEYHMGTNQEQCDLFSTVTEEVRVPTYEIFCVDRFVPEYAEIGGGRKLRRVADQILGNDAEFLGVSVFEWGSEAPFHCDFANAPRPGSKRLMVGWLALDDITLDNGPVACWKGSHRLVSELMLKEGKPNGVNDSREFVARACQKLKPEQYADKKFLSRAGDLVIWNELLLHAGCPIINPDMKRRALLLIWQSHW